VASGPRMACVDGKDGVNFGVNSHQPSGLCSPIESRARCLFPTYDEKVMSPHRIPAWLGQLEQHHPTAALLLTRAADFWLRLAEAPPVAWAMAALVSLLAAAGHDPFTWAWVLLIVFSAADYMIGTARAREMNAYNKAEAARGRREKVNTALFMLGFRALEGYATGYGLLNLAAVLKFLHFDGLAASPVVRQGGIVSAVIAILLAFDELRSIYLHRIADGGSRILFAELAFNGARAAQRFVLGRAAKAVEGWAGEAEGRSFQQNTLALRQIDEAGHAMTHDGEPAPMRRHYDEAVIELQEQPGQPGDHEASA